MRNAFTKDSETFFVIKDHLGSVRMVVDSTHSMRSYYDYTAFGNVFRSGVNEQVRYQYTGQEYDHEIGLHNYRARFYDSDLGRFYGVDVAGQFWSPYLYVGNNPVLLVDPDGEFAITTAILVAAGIGAVWNTYDNWDNIQNAGDFFGYLGLGAVAGGLGATNPGGWFAGGFLLGAGNTLLGGGNLGGAFQNGALGGFTSLAGGVGGTLGRKFGNFTFNGFAIKSPFLRGLFGGTIGSFAGATLAAGTGTLLNGGNFSDALNEGLAAGLKAAPIGAATGAGAASIQAHKSGINPLTGNANIKGLTATDLQRIRAASDFKAGIIDSDQVRQPVSRGGSAIEFTLKDPRFGKAIHMEKYGSGNQYKVTVVEISGGQVINTRVTIGTPLQLGLPNIDQYVQRGVGFERHFIGN